jgi:putrescine transport system permease protein
MIGRWFALLCFPASGPGASALPIVVFSSIRLGATPELYALANIIVAVAATGLLAGWRLYRA